MELVNVIESLQGNYGPQVKDNKGKYYSFGKFYKGDTDLEPGAYDMDVFRSAKGNAYINSLTKVTPKASAVKQAAKPKDAKAIGKLADIPATATEVRATHVKMGATTPDWDGIARGKVKSLFVEALLSNPNVVQEVANLDTTVIKQLVNEMTDFVFEK